MLTDSMVFFGRLPLLQLNMIYVGSAVILTICCIASFSTTFFLGNATRLLFLPFRNLCWRSKNLKTMSLVNAIGEFHALKGQGGVGRSKSAKSQKYFTKVCSIGDRRMEMEENEKIDVTLVGTERNIVIVKYLIRWRINYTTITSLATASLPCTVIKNM